MISTPLWSSYSSAARELANLPHAALDLLFRSGHGDTHIVFRHRAKVASGGHGNIAHAQEIKRKLSPWLLAAVSDIDQGVKCAMRRVEVAIMLFEQAYYQVAAAAISISHLGNAFLRPA